MNKKLKQKWVKTLRSGKYKQGKGELRSPDGSRYCCLGVLHLCKGGQLRPGQGTTSSKVKNGFISTKILPVLTQRALAEMNDIGGKSFSDIADYIEVNL